MPDELEAMIESIGRRLVDGREQLHFEVRSLGAVFLDEVGRRERLIRVFGEAQAVARCARRQADFFELSPGLVDVFAQVGFSVWSRVGRNDVQPARQILGRPTGADDSRTDDCNTTNWFFE